MPEEIQATARWSDFQHELAKSSSITFDVIGAKTSVEAATANGIFRPNDQCPWDPLLSAKNPSVRRPAPGLWQVTVQFVGNSGQSLSKDPDPLKQPTKRKWEPSSVSELFDRDKDGLALRNAANNSFEQPFSKDKTVLFLNATRNFADFDPTLSTKYGNTINSKDFSLFGRYRIPKQTCKCHVVQPLVEYDENAKYVPVSVRLEFHDRPFQLRVLNQGKNAWGSTSDGGAKPGLLYDPQLQPVSGDVLLDETGVPLDDGYTVGKFHRDIVACPSSPTNYTVETSDDGTVFLLFDIEDELDFSPLLKMFRIGG